MNFRKEIKNGVLFVEGKQVKKVLKMGDWIWYVVKVINRKKVPFMYDAYVHGFADEFGSVYVSELSGAHELPLDEIPVESPASF